MDRRLFGLVVVAIALSGVVLTWNPPGTTASTSPADVRALAVNLNLNYSDPASDVAQMWTSNNTHVTDAAGYWIMGPAPGEVNLGRLSSTDKGTSIYLYLRVQTAIATLPNVTYQIRLYSRSSNASHFELTYWNGWTTLRTNLTGSAVTNLTSTTAVPSGFALGITVDKAYLGNISAWNIDATAKKVEQSYTYEDFVWQQPGNPGSAPAFIQGRVTDAVTKVGLANATVTSGAGGYTTSTNATGFYYLPAAPGTYNLTFAHSGYVNLTKAVTVNYQQTQTVDAALSKAVPPPSGLLVLFILIAVVLIAAAFVIVLTISRRRKVPPPPPK